MTPLVSIVIPVGPSHRQYVGTAVASALAGSVPNVEVIVVNDTKMPMGQYADRRVRVIEAPDKPGLRPSIARNAGIALATAPFLINLDADDYLLRDGIATLIRGHAEHDRAYSYGQQYGMREDGAPITDSMGRPHAYGYGIKYDQWDYTQANLHTISALLPTDAVREVGGFDEGAPAWDDWTLYARLRHAGYCGAPVHAPVFVVREYLSQQHHTDNEGGAERMAQTRARIIGKGWNPMGCGCGGGAAAAKSTARAILGAGALPVTGGDVRALEYIGPGEGAQWFSIPGTNRKYRAGANPAVRVLHTSMTLDEQDIPYLVGLGLFREIPPAPAYAPPPEPIEPEAVASVVASESQEVPDDFLGMSDSQGVLRPRGRSIKKEGS